MAKIADLKKQYEYVCNEYAERFSRKQGMVFDGWVANSAGGVAYCNDFFFNFSDIALDMNSRQPKVAIIDWYYGNEDGKFINYYSYTKGLRIKDIKEDAP